MTTSRNNEVWKLWIVGNIFGAALIFRDFFRLDDGLVANDAYWGRDFINIWTSGQAVIHGKTQLLYDLSRYLEYARSIFGPIGQHNFSYPPLVLPMNVLFALLPYWLALGIWLAGTGWLFMRAAEPWWRTTGLPAWLVLLTPAALINIWAGHYGFLIGALFLFGWRSLEYKPAIAGICFGLMAVKPHLAILIPLVLLLRNKWRAITSAVLTIASLTAFSIALFGVQPWIEYFTVTAGVQSAMIDAHHSFFRYMSTSPMSAAIQMGLSYRSAVFVQILFATLGLGATAWAARRASLVDTALISATATFLVLPYAFNYDLTVTAVAAGMLIFSDHLSKLENRVAIGGFMAAQIGMAFAGQELFIMPVLLTGLLVVQLRRASLKSSVFSTWAPQKTEFAEHVTYRIHA